VVSTSIAVVSMDNMQMPTMSRGRAIAYFAVVLGLLAIGGKLLIGGARSEPAEGTQETIAALEVESEGTAQAAEPALLVHVVGAVRRPGLYRLKSGSRIDDAIRQAGGPKRRAALELVNLAAPVSDGQQVVVPARGRASPVTAPGATGGPVHLNSATLEQLDALPGIGPVTAQNILDYREEHGSFSSIDELDAVPGIGPARLEQLREVVAP
jgi:competence protein ComEA